MNSDNITYQDWLKKVREDKDGYKQAYEVALCPKEFVLAKIKSSRPTSGFGTLGMLAIIAVVLVLAGGSSISAL